MFNELVGFGAASFIVLIILSIMIVIDLNNKSIDNDINKQIIIIDTIYIDTCYVN